MSSGSGVINWTYIIVAVINVIVAVAGWFGAFATYGWWASGQNRSLDEAFRERC